jgi:hypothetical protein
MACLSSLYYLLLFTGEILSDALVVCINSQWFIADLVSSVSVYFEHLVMKAAGETDRKISVAEPQIYFNVAVLKFLNLTLGSFTL